MTFYGLIVGSVPPSAEVIANGDDEAWVRDRLDSWVNTHPLDRFHEALVVSVVEEPSPSAKLQPSVSVGIKLASLAVHTEEMIETGIIIPDGPAAFDCQAIQALLADPEIVAFLDVLRPLALLPEKR